MTEPDAPPRIALSTQGLWLLALVIPVSLVFLIDSNSCGSLPEVLHNGDLDRAWMFRLAISKKPPLFVLFGALFGVGVIAALFALVRRSRRALGFAVLLGAFLLVAALSSTAALRSWGPDPEIWSASVNGQRYQPILTFTLGTAAIASQCFLVALAQIRLDWPRFGWAALWGMPTLAAVVAWSAVVMRADGLIVSFARDRWVFAWTTLPLVIGLSALVIGLAQVVVERRRRARVDPRPG